MDLTERTFTKSLDNLKSIHAFLTAFPTSIINTGVIKLQSPSMDSDEGLGAFFTNTDYDLENFEFRSYDASSPDSSEGSPPSPSRYHYYRD
jgi:hypothetical protein